MLNSTENKDKSLNILLDQLKVELLSYINKRLRLFKLEAYEKSSIAVSKIGYSLIFLIIIAVMLFFFLFALAFFIGELIGSIAAGFGILALASLVTLVIVKLFAKDIRRSLLNKTINFIRKVEIANDEE